MYVAQLRVTLKKSGIGSPRDQKDTLKALGFSRVEQTIVKDDTPSIRGMLHKVRHLVEVKSE